MADSTTKGTNRDVMKQVTSVPPSPRQIGGKACGPVHATGIAQPPRRTMHAYNLLENNRREGNRRRVKQTCGGAATRRRRAP